MGMFNEYPYRNLTDLNLDYIFKIMKEVEKQVEYFVSLNAIKYADPIQWDITRQYEKNTIVIDPLTGTAYISVAPVPAGTALTRPEYWTVVFDLQRFVTKACKNFTTRYEAETTTTATFNTPKGGWLCWADVLYKANVNITAGDSYVPGGNITAFTMEDFGGHLDNLLTTNKSNVVAAINELVNILIQMSVNMGDLNDLTTVDKTSIVNAINELVTEISNAISIIGDINDLTTTDKASVVNAINEIVTNVGDLNNLMTSDKTSIVNAINDINSIIPPGVDYITPEMFGAVGDGLTDDYASIVNAMNECQSTGKMLYLLNRYHISNTITLDDTNYDITANGDAGFNYTDNGTAVLIKNCFLHTYNFSIYSKDTDLGEEYTNVNSIGLLIESASNCKFNIPYIGAFYKGISLEANAAIAWNEFTLNYLHNCMYYIYATSSSSGYVNENIFITGRCQIDTGISYNGSTIGVYFNGSTSNLINSNHFLKLCAESMLYGIRLNNCRTNYFDDVRMEGTPTILYCEGKSENNKVEYGYLPAYPYTSILIDNTDNKTNIVTSRVKPLSIPIYNSKCIPSKAIGSNTDSYIDEDICSLLSSGGSVIIADTLRPITAKDSMYITIDHVGIMIAPRDEKLFYIKCNCNDKYFPIAVFWDSNGNEITSYSGDSSYDVDKLYYSNGGIIGNVNCFTSGSRDENRICNFFIPDNVATMFIGVKANDEKINSFEVGIYDTNSNFGIISGSVKKLPYILSPDKYRGVTTIPSIPGYKGQYVMNVGSDNTIRGWFYDGAQWQVDTF